MTLYLDYWTQAGMIEGALIGFLAGITVASLVYLTTTTEKTEALPVIKEAEKEEEGPSDWGKAILYFLETPDEWFVVNNGMTHKPSKFHISFNPAGGRDLQLQAIAGKYNINLMPLLTETDLNLILPAAREVYLHYARSEFVRATQETILTRHQTKAL